MTLSGQLTIYHPSGKAKGEQFFWLSADTLEINWGKELRAKKCETHKLQRVLDGPAIPHARDLFAKIDEDGSGDLIADEVAELYKEVLGQKLTKPALNAAMMLMDTDRSGTVSVQEFEAWWAQNGGDLEVHRDDALTFVCDGGVELIVVAPDEPSKRRWADGCEKLGLLEPVPAPKAYSDDAAGPLPPGWETAVSQSTGDTYYINDETGESTYDRPEPPPPPPGSEEAKAAAKAAKRKRKRQRQHQKAKEKAAAAKAKAAGSTASDDAAQSADQMQASESSLQEVTADLPPGWEAQVSSSTGEVYYVNTVTQESTYDKPTERAFTDSFLSTAGPSAEQELPVGWESAVSNSTGETYYVNTLSGESQYERPTAPADEEGIVV